MSGFTVTSHYWKHVWVFVFVVSDVGIWEKPAFVGTALWNGLLSGCLRYLLTSGLSPLLERPDIYNGLYLLGKKGKSIHRAENLLAHSLLLVR